MNDVTERENCNICSHHIFEKITESNKARYVICRGCGLTRIAPIPSAEELKEFYQNSYRSQHSLGEKPSEVSFNYEKERGQTILPHIQKYLTSAKTLIDIGCSCGGFLSVIKEKFPHIELSGVELNSEYLNNATQKTILPKERAFNFALENIKSVGMKFDFLSLIHVLEHLRDPLLFLKEVQTLMTPTSKLYVEVPNLLTPYENLKKNYFVFYHLYYFTPNTLENMANRAGLQVEERIYNTTSVGMIFSISTSQNKPLLNDYKLIKKKLLLYQLWGEKVYLLKKFLKKVLKG